MDVVWKLLAFKVTESTEKFIFLQQHYYCHRAEWYCWCKIIPARLIVDCSIILLILYYCYYITGILLFQKNKINSILQWLYNGDKVSFYKWYYLGQKSKNHDSGITLQYITRNTRPSSQRDSAWLLASWKPQVEPTSSDTVVLSYSHGFLLLSAMEWECTSLQMC